MKYIYNIENNVVVQEFQEQPNFECWLYTENMEANLVNKVKPQVINGEVVETATAEEILLFFKERKTTAKRMYFLLALLQLHDIKTDQIITAIKQVPNEFLREAMLIKFNTAAIFEREDSGLNMLAPVFGLSAEDLDAVFNLANRLDPTPIILY